MTTQAAPPSVLASASSGILRRWPTWVAIIAVVLITFDGTEGADEAPALAAAAFAYLGAATFRKPSAAWTLFFGALVVIFAMEAAFGDDVDPTWMLLGLSVPLLAYGLWSSATRSYEGFRLQAIGMLGFGVATAVALGASEDVAAYVLAAGLVGHTLWDAYHYRANKVVVRSLAEFCFVLDLLLAVIIVSVTI